MKCIACSTYRQGRFSQPGGSSPSSSNRSIAPSRSPVTARYAACWTSIGVSSMRPTITASKRNPPMKKAVDSSRA